MFFNFSFITLHKRNNFRKLKKKSASQESGQSILSGFSGSSRKHGNRSIKSGGSRVITMYYSSSKEGKSLVA